MMIEIVVYLSADYSKNESIWVSDGMTKDQITEIIDDKYDEWYYFDII